MSVCRAAAALRALARTPAAAAALRQRIGGVRRVSAYGKSVTGLQQGAPDDPIVWKMDMEDETFDHTKADTYRNANEYFSPFDERLVKIFSGIFWAWIFYRLYWNYDTLTGEFHPPSVYSFSDEQLGIPADGDGDPEYWGDHHIHNAKNKSVVL